VAAGEKLKKEQ